MSEDRMARVEELLEMLAGEIAAIRAEMATKQDLDGVAKNVDVTLLGRQMKELLAMKDDVTVLTAMVQRIDNTMVRQMSDVLTEVRAEHSRMDRLLNRVRALEDAQLPEGSC